MTKERELTQQDVHDIFGVLYKELDEAYWSATTIVDKDRIRGVQGIVFDIITELNKANIKSGTPKFTELISKVNSVNKRLDELKKDIDKIIHRIEIATRVAMAIDKALAMAANFFV